MLALSEHQLDDPAVDAVRQPWTAPSCLRSSLLLRVFDGVLRLVDGLVDLLSGLLSGALVRARTRSDGDRRQREDDDEVANDLHAAHYVVPVTARMFNREQCWRPSRPAAEDPQIRGYPRSGAC